MSSELTKQKEISHFKEEELRKWSNFKMMIILYGDEYSKERVVKII